MRHKYILLLTLLLASCGGQQRKHGSPMVNKDIVEEIPQQVIAADTVETVVDSVITEPEEPVTKETRDTSHILPNKRIVAYYGNLYSKKMGVLGEYPPEQLWTMLRKEVAAWEAADSLTPVQPAIHYIATTAQGSPGKAGKYRLRMPNSQIDSAYTIAKMGDAILILDIQTGLSDVMTEVPVIEEYLKRPDVHLAVDPEFSMKDGTIPGKKIGTMDATDINWCIDYLTNIVKENNLPPKVLVVHRFTMKMLTNYQNIHPTPEVQVVINMDGWGGPALKRSTYKMCITPEPVQFTGFKLFYKNDLKGGGRLMTPEEILALNPTPIYIQYQ